jgi:hypothetical protein
LKSIGIYGKDDQVRVVNPVARRNAQHPVTGIDFQSPISEKRKKQPMKVGNNPAVKKITSFWGKPSVC